MGGDWYAYRSIVACGLLIPRKKLIGDWCSVDVRLLCIYQGEYVPYVFVYVKETMYKSETIHSIGRYDLKEYVTQIERMECMDKFVRADHKQILQEAYKCLCGEEVEESNKMTVNYWMITSNNWIYGHKQSRIRWYGYTPEEANQTLKEVFESRGYGEDSGDDGNYGFTIIVDGKRS